jgi:hypothetical protein
MAQAVAACGQEGLSARNWAKKGRERERRRGDADIISMGRDCHINGHIHIGIQHFGFYLCLA